MRSARDHNHTAFPPKIRCRLDPRPPEDSVGCWRASSRRSLADSSGKKTFQTTSVTQELVPFLADLLDFRLLMIDQREQVLVPPRQTSWPRRAENDHGCVKTCTSRECAELFSLSSSLSSGRKHFWFSNRSFHATKTRSGRGTGLRS